MTSEHRISLHGAATRGLCIGLLVAATLTAGVAAAQSGTQPPAASAPVPIRVDNLPPWVAARLLEKAKIGVEAIRQYLWRTRMIHNIYIGDILDYDRSRP